MRHRSSTPAAFTLLVLILASPAAEAGDADRRYVWDLSTLVADHSSWEAERDWVLARIETIGELEGQAAEGPSHLADVLDAAYVLRARATRLAIYGFLASDVDTSSERGRLYYDAGTALEHQALGAVAFVTREVQDLGRERIEEWIAAEPRLERHRRWIADLLRLAPYTLDAQAEAVIESAARWPRLSADLFSPLHAAPTGWRTVRLVDGGEVTANRPGYLSVRRSEVRADRLAVSRAYLDHLVELEELFGLLYTRRIEADLTLARQRGFDDAIEALWLRRDGMPPGSLRPMIEVTRAHLDTLRRYLAVRARMLGVDRLALVDLHAPVPGLPGHVPIPTAVETATSALATLGPDLESAVRALVDRPWMHLEATPNKARSYSIWPSVDGSPPYFFYAYQGSLEDSRRVAGGLALQAAFASIPPGATPSTRDDPGIYANGMIYVGDLLHDDLVVSRAASREERAATLLHSLDFLWQQFFRWVPVVELDVEVQERILAGEPPSGAEVSRLYLELLRDHYGDGDGPVALEPGDGAEWMTFSVPFLSFEHQFWPAAVAMAAALVERVEAGDTEVGERCWRLLGRGEVDRTYQMLGSIGLDMASKEPYEAVVRRMDSLLDALETQLEGDRTAGRRSSDG